MTDRDALLRAICEAPDDDAPRLVYADWLDEHGDPRQAEFIRVQIALARVPPEQRPGHPLAAREEELFADNESWKDPIGHAVQTVANFDRDKFRRGFHHIWYGEVGDFVRLPKDWWRYGPIDRVMIGVSSIKTADLKYAERAATRAILPHVRTVCLLGPHVGQKWLAAFLTGSAGCHWKRFEVLGRRTPDSMALLLAGSWLVATETELFIDPLPPSEAARLALRDAFGARLADRSETGLGLPRRF